MQRAELRAWGGPAQGAIDDLNAVIGAGLVSGQNIRAPGQPAVTRDLVLLTRLALAEARNGDMAKVGALAKEIRERCQASDEARTAPPAVTTNKRSQPDAALFAQLADLARREEARRATYARQRLPLIDAYLLLADGRTAEARELVIGKSLPPEPAMIDLTTRLAPGAHENVSGADAQAAGDGLRDAVRQERMSGLNLMRFAHDLPPPEPGQKRDSYSSQWGWGLKAAGFKDRPITGREGRTIEFSGISSQHASVEEMMLMRAAQLAIANGRSGFVLTDRRDFRQEQVTTLRGSEIGRAPAGFKVEADVVFVDPAQAASPDGEGALDARQVWSDLSEVYGGGPLKAD